MFKVEAIGNLGADAEVRDSNGSKFISFRIAHSDKWEDENGKSHERTQWIDVIISDADSKLLPYLRQGVKVFVRGHASLRVYSSPKERMMVAGIQVKAQDIELCGGSNDAVPRELVNPDTSELIQITKFYYANAETKGMKREDSRSFIDKRGNEYIMDYHGWVTPKPAETEKAGE